MQKNKMLAGFTLIELLLVIVILGIVISIALSIINPAKIQRRSRESVLIAQASKLCTALYACASTAEAGATDCDTISEVGAVTPAGTPTGSTYGFNAVTAGNVAVTLTATLPAGNGSKVASADCTVTCSYDFSTGVPTAIAKNTTNCY